MKNSMTSKQLDFVQRMVRVQKVNQLNVNKTMAEDAGISRRIRRATKFLTDIAFVCSYSDRSDFIIT